MYCMGKEVFLVGTAFLCISSLIRLLLWQQVCVSVDTQRERAPRMDRQEPEEAAHINAATHPVLLKQAGLDLFIHTAFHDDRFAETIVRILAMQRKSDALDGWKCRTMGKGGYPVETIAKRTMIDTSWPWWGHHYACSFDCHFPPGLNPQEVILSSPNDTYTFTVSVERAVKIKPRKTLAVCVKPAKGQLDPTRLVEWFEILTLAGIENFIIYDLDVYGSARVVLEYYKNLGVVTLVSFPYPRATVESIDYPGYTEGKRDAVYQQTYIVGMIDCLYRFYGTYENLLYLDLDEILLPVRNETITDVIKTLRKLRPNGVGFLFNTSWHFSDHPEISDSTTPSYLYMQRHLVGTFPLRNQPKSVVVTEKAISVNFHSVLDVPEKKYSNEVVKWQDFGYVYHFRTGTCLDKFFEDMCEYMMKNTRVDPLLPRYKSDLMRRVPHILQYLSII